MKKKILVIAVALMFVAMLAAPVMAAPATKKEVTVAMDVAQSTDPDSIRVVDHGILHMRGTSAGTFNITIAGQDPLNFTWAGEWAVRSKGLPLPNPEGEALIRGKVLLTSIGEGTTGTFEGMIHKRMKGLPAPVSTYLYSRTVLHGTGDFQGQTLKLSFEGAPPEALAGYIIIPK